jgi:hypothetical protein
MLPGYLGGPRGGKPRTRCQACRDRQQKCDGPGPGCEKAKESGARDCREITAITVRWP